MWYNMTTPMAMARSRSRPGARGDGGGFKTGDGKTGDGFMARQST
jgi:hypothetical protein